jgi:hypothetical protein
MCVKSILYRTYWFICAGGYIHITQPPDIPLWVINIMLYGMQREMLKDV